MPCARAGAKVFDRGKAYHRKGRAEILSVDSARVLAQVEGSDDYRTVLTGRGKKIGGECSCPAFGDWGICKHMVAVALAANETGDEAAAGNDASSRIRAHLKERGVDALIGMIMEMAERDIELFHKLDLAALARHADDKTIEARLRRVIDAATRMYGYSDDDEEADIWFEGVAEALDAVAELASGTRAALALKLAMHALSCIGDAAGENDDPESHCGRLLARARDIHLAACRAAKPDPVTLARDLFTRELEGECGAFHRAAALYAKPLGKMGLAEYRRLTDEAWRKQEGAADNDRLVDIVDFFAERDGDVEKRIALRARDLSSPWRYRQLAEFCLAQGRKDDALRHAEEGLWMFEDGRPDQLLLLFAVGLLEKAGRKTDAETHLWRAFGKEPTLELYQRLRKLIGQSACEKAVAQLEASLTSYKPLNRQRLADLLVGLLMSERMFDAAWAAARKYRGSIYSRQDLAKASEATHPVEALAVYAEEIEQLVLVSRYEDAVRLIRRMARLRSAAEQSSYVADIKERHRRKYKFMKMLGTTQ
ncbi:MAG: SWIM zinc finger family protein [Alphaproteobacteria bacterium]|nr:SWIM zinc finger family protein [Alphaproteobacteria bacterium]